MPASHAKKKILPAQDVISAFIAQHAPAQISIYLTIYATICTISSITVKRFDQLHQLNKKTIHQTLPH